MSTAQVVQTLIERAWLAPLIPVTWLVLKLTRTAARILRAQAWIRALRGSGVTDDECRKLITDAARQDLKSP